MHKKIISVFIFLPALFFFGTSYAMLAPECRDIGAIVKKADVIIEGEVIKSEVQETEKGQISTIFGIRVDRYVKGEGPDVIALKIPGGCVGGMCVEASGTPRFQVGQKGFLCLKNPQNNEPDLKGFFSPVCGRGMLEKLPDTEFSLERK